MEKQTASPRSKFLARFSDKELASVVWDVLKLASSHDPDHEREISRISKKLGRLELVTANETNSIADIFIDLYKRVKAIECTIKK